MYVSLFFLVLLASVPGLAQSVVAPLAPGEILFSDYGANAILRISADRSSVSIWMGNLTTPGAIVVQPDGSVIFLHSGTTVRRVAPDGTWVDQYIGELGAAGVAVAANGDLIVACDGEPPYWPGYPPLLRVKPDGSTQPVSSSWFKSEDVEIDLEGNIIGLHEYDGLFKFLGDVYEPQPGVPVPGGSGFWQPCDFLIDPDGSYVVSDFGHWTLERVAADGSRLVLATDLEEVGSVARLFNGDYIVAVNHRYEPTWGRLLRVPYDGVPAGETAAFFSGDFLYGVGHIAVVPWIGGFLPPADNLPSFNRAKAGSAIPVKFNIGGNMGMNIFASGYPRSLRIACEGGTPQDDIEETVTAGSSSLKYDAASNQYIYVWKTDKSWGGTCRQLIVRLIDGSEHKANFTFTR
jgi:hypothetical protein